MKTTAHHGNPPKILPWLAKKAGITERRAEVLWHAAQRHAVLRTGESDTPAYWKATMDRLLELIAAETLREDVASFGWRRWARLQAQWCRAPLTVIDALSLVSMRGLRLAELYTPAR